MQINLLGKLLRVISFRKESALCYEPPRFILFSVYNRINITVMKKIVFCSHFCFTFVSPSQKVKKKQITLDDIRLVLNFLLAIKRRYKFNYRKYSTQRTLPGAHYPSSTMKRQNVRAIFEAVRLSGERATFACLFDVGR